MTETLTYIILGLSLIGNILFIREIRSLRKERDYYIELDEENARLKEKA